MVLEIKNSEKIQKTIVLFVFLFLFFTPNYINAQFNIGDVNYAPLEDSGGKLGNATGIDINDYSNLIQTFGLEDTTNMLNNIGSVQLNNLIDNPSIGIGGIEQFTQAYGVDGFIDTANSLGTNSLSSFINSSGSITNLTSNFTSSNSLINSALGSSGSSVTSAINSATGGSLGGFLGSGDVCETPNSIINSVKSAFNKATSLAGTHVPVSDSRTHKLLGEINKDTAKSQYLLKVLCEKEYKHDVELKNAWSEVIGQFVSNTQSFITRGLGAGNPYFITNQNAYYQLVNLATTRVFLKDISDSNIGETTKETIIRVVMKDLFDTKFPYYGPELAPDDLADDLADDFYGSGGYSAYSNLLFNPGINSQSLVDVAINDLENRKSQQIEFEKEKLNWGRGFFSNELCDLAIYNNNSEDRRNCRIATPGSLIQDQTSFVFGSALRQMELADEYGEWVAPNTLAVLSDILSTRTLNDEGSSRGRAFGSEVTNTPKSPEDILNTVDIDYNAPQDDNPPVEFYSNIDFQLENSGSGSEGFQEIFFTDFLYPEEFLNNTGP